MSVCVRRPGELGRLEEAPLGQGHAWSMKSQ